MKYTTISEYLDTDDPNLILEHNTIAAVKANNKQEEIFVQLCMDIRKSFPDKSDDWIEKQARTVVRTNLKNVKPKK